MVGLAVQIELANMVAVQRLDHADPSESHRAAILGGLGDAMRSGLNFFRSVL